jgi:hypothetical protein
MKRAAVSGITLLLLWAIVPGVGEILENAVHLVREGHFAHATPDGDHHDPSGPEHGCTGTMHLCSCCFTLSALPSGATPEVPNLESRQFVAQTSVHLPTVSAGGVYHPPRA